MTSSKFNVRFEAPQTATRPNGVSARLKLLERLGTYDEVIVDLEGVKLTPSFADEFLGVLLVQLGVKEFRQSVRIINVSDMSRPLLKTVLNRRSSSTAGAGNDVSMTH